MEVVPTHRIYSSVIVAAVLIFACDGGPEEKRAQPSPRGTSSCPNEADVIASSETQEGPTRDADIDGDGRDDAVRLQLDFEAPIGCQAFVVVETATGSLVEPVWAMGGSGGLPQPSLYSFSNLDRQPGYEILVNEASGASTQFVAAYGFRSGELEPIQVPDNENGLFAFGGSVGHLEAVDCTSEGDIVISSAVPAAGRAAADKGLYQVRRTIYSLDRELKKQEAELNEVAIEELEQFPEFRSGPFGSCAAP